jgi:2-methylisocitrate lyase-like PEP mutase family enzyme
MDDSTLHARRRAFLDLHHQDGPFLLGNAWDAGSARLLAAVGYPALATTSSGAAMRTGRLDYQIDKDTALAAGSELAAAVDVPVSVDFEDGFGADPDAVAENVAELAGTGVAGCSIEDYTRDVNRPIYDIGAAVERVTAAAESAHAGPGPLVLTARTELLLHGAGGLDDVIDRLQRYQEAGADVLFAPGLDSADDIAAVVQAVELPVSVMALPGSPTVPALAALGVKRVSLGAWFAYAALRGLHTAALEVIEHGTFEFTSGMSNVSKLTKKAFGAWRVA